MAVDPVTRGRPRSAEADGQILAATLDHLRERGYRDLSIEHVAAAAGVSKATVYRRYRNKADLASAAIAVVSAERYGAPVADDTRTAIVDHLRGFECTVAEVGIGVLGSLLDERDPEVLELHRERTIARGRQRLTEILARAQQRGEIRPDADRDTATEMLIGAYFARRLDGRDAPHWAEAAVDMLLRGLAR
jgi:AcrR family transcriptional regulator